MKATIAYYLLIIYAVAFFKPVLPVVSDFFAHTFTQKQHIATVHLHNGEKHVHKEVADAGKSHNGQQSTATKFSEPVSVHVVSAQAKQNALPLNKQQLYCNFLEKAVNLFLYKAGPPPKL